MKVPSTSNLEILIWVKSVFRRSSKLSSDCVNQQCHSDKKIKTMRRQQAHKVSHLMAEGNLEHLPIHQGSRAVVPCPRGLPSETTRKTDWLTRHERKRDSDGALFWREHGMSVQKGRT